MKPNRPKTEQVKLVQGKIDPLPSAAELVPRARRVVRHVDFNSFQTVAADRRPDLDGQELARIAGVLNLPSTSKGASAALRFAWQCAEVLAEQNADIAWNEANDAATGKKRKKLVALLGFDPTPKSPINAAGQEYPINHQKFLSLLAKRRRDSVKINGKEYRGAALFRQFLFHYLSLGNVKVDAGTPSECWRVRPVKTVKAEMVDRTIREWQAEGWLSPIQVEPVAREFILWRERKARENKKRTKKNLTHGDV